MPRKYCQWLCIITTSVYQSTYHSPNKLLHQLKSNQYLYRDNSLHHHRVTILLYHSVCLTYVLFKFWQLFIKLNNYILNEIMMTRSMGAIRSVYYFLVSISTLHQCAMKVASKCAGLMYFTVWSVDSVLHMPNGQIEIQMKFKYSKV